MPFDVTPLGTPQRRGREGCIDDVVEYFFRVSDGESYRDVPVGISGPAINPVGEPPRPKETLSKLAEAWLRHHLEKRQFDPFKESAARVQDVPTEVVDHWIDHGELLP